MIRSLSDLRKIWFSDKMIVYTSRTNEKIMIRYRQTKSRIRNRSKWTYHQFRRMKFRIVLLRMFQMVEKAKYWWIRMMMIQHVKFRMFQMEKFRMECSEWWSLFRNGDTTNFGTTSNSGCPSFVIVAEPNVPNCGVPNVPNREACSKYFEWWRWSLRYNSKLGLPLIRNHNRIFQMVVLLISVQLQTRVTPHSLLQSPKPKVGFNYLTNTNCAKYSCFNNIKRKFKLLKPKMTVSS